MNEVIESKTIALQNDRFRKELDRSMGKVVVTSGIDALDFVEQMTIISKVRTFDAFNQDNNPHSEHDFGAFDHNDHRVIWKIDYYDVEYKWGSEDPANTKLTRRVLTIMLASEY